MQWSEHAPSLNSGLSLFVCVCVCAYVCLQILELIEEDFNKRWAEPDRLRVPGWHLKGKNVDAAAGNAADGSTNTTATHDSANPLFCKACQKSFAKQTVFDAHLTVCVLSLRLIRDNISYAECPFFVFGSQGKKHQKAAALLTAQAATNGKVNSAALEAQSRLVALKEDQIAKLAELLSDRITATQQYMERKQTWTDREREVRYTPH